jgi:hypothetical protein
MPVLAHRCLAAIVCVGALVTTGPASVARAAEPVPPGDAALDWLGGELAANDGMLMVTFGTDAFPDPGLTIDAILAELAGGNGGDAAVQTAIGAVDAAVFDYVNQQSTFPADRAANATAKALLLQGVLGSDLGSTVDLEADLRSLMAVDGEEIGRFNDSDLQGFGNYANGLGQALAILALDRTAGGVPAEAVDFLLDQQCPDGSFRLYYFGYVTSYDPFETVAELTCTDPAAGDVDATALALSALLAVPSTSAVAAAVDGAVGFLAGAQLPSGGFVGTGATNANSTGLAAQALRAAGADAEADRAAAYVADRQLRTCADFGALAYDDAGFAAGIATNRDQWIRATTQGVLGLGLPSYADIGVVEAVPAGLAAVACQAAPVPGEPQVAPTTSSPTAAVASGALRQIPATGRGTGLAAVVGTSLVGLGALILLAGRGRQRAIRAAGGS